MHELSDYFVSYLGGELYDVGSRFPCETTRSSEF